MAAFLIPAEDHVRISAAVAAAEAASDGEICTMVARQSDDMPNGRCSSPPSPRWRYPR